MKTPDPDLTVVRRSDGGWDVYTDEGIRWIARVYFFKAIGLVVREGSLTPDQRQETAARVIAATV